MTGRSYIAILAVCATVVVVICVISSRNHGPVKTTGINNLRPMAWALEQNELEAMAKAKTNVMTFTNTGSLDQSGRKVTHVFTNGVWLEVGEMPNGTPTNTTP